MNKLLYKILLTLILFGNFQMYGQSTSIMSFNIRYDNPNDKENVWEKNPPIKSGTARLLLQFIKLTS